MNRPISCQFCLNSLVKSSSGPQYFVTLTTQVQLLKNYIIRQYVQPKDFRHIMIVLLYPKVFSLKFNNWNNFFEVIFKNKYNLESILVLLHPLSESSVLRGPFLRLCAVI